MEENVSFQKHWTHLQSRRTESSLLSMFSFLLRMGWILLWDCNFSAMIFVYGKKTTRIRKSADVRHSNSLERQKIFLPFFPGTNSRKKPPYTCITPCDQFLFWHRRNIYSFSSTDSWFWSEEARTPKMGSIISRVSSAIPASNLPNSEISFSSIFAVSGLSLMTRQGLLSRNCTTVQIYCCMVPASGRNLCVVQDGCSVLLVGNSALHWKKWNKLNSPQNHKFSNVLSPDVLRFSRNWTILPRCRLTMGISKQRGFVSDRDCPQVNAVLRNVWPATWPVNSLVQDG